MVMLDKKDFEHIGVVGKPHGVHGELSLHVDVDLLALTEFDRPFIMLEQDGLLIPYRVLSHRSKGSDIDLVTLDGVVSKEHAESLVGLAVWLPQELTSQEEERDLLDWQRYVGYTLVDEITRILVGRVVHIDESTINTIAFVEDEVGYEHIIPLAEELLVGVDDQARIIAVNVPEGLLDDSAEYDIHD